MLLELALQHRIHLGESLRSARVAKGLTASQVAQAALGLPHAHAAVGRLERGCSQRIPFERLQPLLDFYEMGEAAVLVARTRDGALSAETPPPQRTHADRVRQLRLAFDMDRSTFARLTAVPGNGDASATAIVEAWERGLLLMNREDYECLEQNRSVDCAWLAADDEPMRTWLSSRASSGAMHA